MSESVWNPIVGEHPSFPSIPPSPPGRSGLGPQGPPRLAIAGPPMVSQPPVGAQPPQESLAPTRPPLEGEKLLGVQPEPTKPKSRFGRIMLAFLAGGLLAAGAFTLGFWSNRDSGRGVAASSPVSTTPVTAQASGPVLVAPENPLGLEPAAFVAAKLGPSIVQVETESGLGSGVVFRDGLILTNHHVIAGAQTIVVRNSEGRAVDAVLIGSDARVDIAVLDVGEDFGAPIAQLALSDEPTVGQTAIAIGSPFQLQQTVTSGIVSALHRPLPTGAGSFTAMIQTDTAINPGNSGGALADRAARVIGIITAIQTDGTGNSNVGVGFAIPIDTAVRVADRIINGETLEAAFLGVGGDTVLGESGVVVDAITPGSSAEAAGLLVGDRVIKIDGAPVTSLIELAGLVQGRFPGDEVELELIRDGSALTITATLGAR